MATNVYIVSATRTPMGSFLGSLSTVPATALGSAAIKGALEQSGVNPNDIDEVFMGNVLQAGEGQAPARQAAMGAGISENVPATTVNKVCASGMKAIHLGRNAIAVGEADLVVAGGMENMSLVPHYLDGRRGSKFGDIKVKDGMLVDGLTDVYNKVHMGNCAELCAKEKESQERTKTLLLSLHTKEQLQHGMQALLIMKLYLSRFLKEEVILLYSLKMKSTQT